MITNRKKIALVAGHTKGKGAAALNGENEHAWNTEVIRHLQQALSGRDVEVIVFHRDPSLKYGPAIDKLAAQIKARGCDVALELHFNSSAPSAHGYEFLHWWRSSKGENLARACGRWFKAEFPTMTQRGGNSGARSLWYHRYNESKAYSGRGGKFVYATHCPAIICEPFFGSNANDCATVQGNPKRYANSLANALIYFLTD